MSMYALATWNWWCRLFHRNWWLREARFTRYPDEGYMVNWCALCNRDRR